MIVHVAAGEAIYREGEPGECAWIVESGRVGLFGVRAGREALLHEAGPACVIGEVAVLTGGRRTDSAVALEPTTLTLVSRAQIAERVVEADPVMRMLLRVTMQNLRREVGAAGGPDLGEAALLLSRQADRPSLSLEKLRLEARLREGLAGRQFELHYQPIVALDSGEIAGFEALVRWRHPTRGLLGPDAFIELAEETALIVPLGTWILEEACRALPRLQARAGRPLTMSVNVSGRQLVADGFAEQVAHTIAAARVSPGQVRLEVTETMLIQEEAARVGLDRCVGAGVTVALDDFGTGFSSLGYLSRLPVHALKIDRSFAAGMLDRPGDLAIVKAVVGLARSMGLDCVLEGVEDPRQARAAADLGCRYAQGWLFARPVPLEGAADLLARGQPAA